MDTNEIRVVANIVAQTEQIKVLQAVLENLVEPSRKEPGCLQYELLQNTDEPVEFTVLEAWDNIEAFNSHLESEHFRKAAAQLPEVVAAEPDIRKYSRLR